MKMKHTFKRILLMLLICCITVAAVTISPASEAEAASFTYNQNVSTEAVTASSTSASMPTAVTKLAGGKSYYFNLQTSNDYFITSAALYVKLSGDSGYTKVYTKSNDGFRIVAYSYTINNTAGTTLSYYWKIDYRAASSSTTKVKQTSTQTLTISSASTKISSTYNSALNSFISNSKWAVGTSWGSSQTPKASSYPCKGCMAYVADIAYKLYGKSSPYKGTSFYDYDSIRAGDILHLRCTDGEQHWIYVYGRSGNNLYVLEGNYKNSSGNYVVYKSTSRYVITTDSSGNQYIKAGSHKYKLYKSYGDSTYLGYHFEPYKKS